jgi:hypothetical protein
MRQPPGGHGAGHSMFYAFYALGFLFSVIGDVHGVLEHPAKQVPHLVAVGM